MEPIALFQPAKKRYFVERELIHKRIDQSKKVTALEMWKRKVSIGQIAKELQVNRNTVASWVQNRNLGRKGRQALLTLEEETWLINLINLRVEIGHPPTAPDIQRDVGIFLLYDDRYHLLEGGVPSKKKIFFFLSDGKSLLIKVCDDICQKVLSKSLKLLQKF